MGAYGVPNPPRNPNQPRCPGASGTASPSINIHNKRVGLNAVDPGYAVDWGQ